MHRLIPLHVPYIGWLTPACRYAYKVTYEKHLTDSSGRVTEVHVTYDPEVKGKPPKGVLSWVACPAPGKQPTRAEIRLYADAVRTHRALRCAVALRTKQKVTGLMNVLAVSEDPFDD